jgi:hypothetical protein
VLALALLVATGLAFIYTESLKLVQSPIRRTVVAPLISPVCRCPTARARISFRLRKADVLTVSVIDTSGNEVRRLATARPERKSVPITFVWNGKVTGGRVAPEGVYRTRVRLDLLEKTITLPNEIRVDTTPPTVKVTSVRPRVISPDHDGRAEYVTVGYSLSEQGHALLRVGGVRRVLGKGVQQTGKLRWFGRIDGHAAPPGRYRLAVVAIDLAGNRSRPAPAGSVRVRYIQFARRSLTVRAGRRFRARVITDAASYGWRFARTSAKAHAKVLVLRAPQRAGRYVLFVDANGHADRMTVVVTKSPPKPKPHRAAAKR